MLRMERFSIKTHSKVKRFLHSNSIQAIGEIKDLQNTFAGTSFVDGRGSLVTETSAIIR